MGIKSEFMKSASQSLKRLHPEWKQEDIERALNHIWKERLKDPTIIMDNNVKEENMGITLTTLTGWIRKTNPVISGNATFYCQPEVHESPTSIMLRTMKKERKSVKKELWKFKPSDDEYHMLDLTQQNIKVVMNAEYGGSGTPTAAFYTKYSPAATTLMAQSIITVMAAFFESYLGNNQVFFGMNECIDWIEKVCNKVEMDIPKWIVRPTHEMVSQRILSKFMKGCITVEGIQFVKRYVSMCSSDELVYLYYANNIRDFVLNHSKVSNMIHDILTSLPNYTIAHESVPVGFNFESVEKYNSWMAHEMFMNPYEIPDVIKDTMNEFISLMTHFIYVEYITPDSIVKLNNHYRNTVLLVDTDSNIINTDLFVSFILNEVFPGESFGRDKMYNEMILVNVICATLSDSVALMLDYYGRMHNMNKEARAELTMKNEFMFRVLFLMTVKKRYTASIVLREGNIIIPFKPEIKGVDFIKAGVSDDVEARFKKMLCDHILFSDELEVHELVNELKRFEREIDNDLRIGNTTYLKQMQFKDFNAYKTPWTQQSFKASVVWNAIYEEKKIYPLDRISLLKTTITGIQDIEPLKTTYPEIYNRIVANIFMAHNEPRLRETGLKLIAIPNTEKTIPEWLIPYIDYDLIISDTMSSFRSILTALRLPDIKYKTPNGKASKVSGIIEL